MALALFFSPSCAMVSEYVDAGQSAAPPAVGAGVGAVVGGPIGAAIGAFVGAMTSFFQHRVRELVKENDDLKHGRTYGHDVAHELADNGTTVPSGPPWYLNPWILAKFAAGWAIAIFILSVLVWRFGHPILRKLRAVLTLGIGPALGKLRELSEEKRIGT